jgi:hypothetical protein
MPFDARVGNEMTYQAAKPANWQPGIIQFNTDKEKRFFILGDYTKEEPEHLRPKLSKFFNFIDKIFFYISIANFESSPAYNKDPLRNYYFYLYD